MDDGDTSLGAIYAKVRRQQQQQHNKSKGHPSVYDPTKKNTKKRHRDEENDNDSDAASSDNYATSRGSTKLDSTGTAKYSFAKKKDSSSSVSSSDESINGNGNHDTDDNEEETDSSEELPSTKTKNAPMEIRANKPVSRFRQVVIVPRKERKDPRFDESTGKLNEHQFTKNYDFLDTYRDDEIKALQNEIKKVKNSEERTAMKDVLTKLLQQRADVMNRRAVADVLYNQQKARKEAIDQGKNPYYPKQREIRELAAVERFKQLETKGGAALDKAIQKKRKKLASKDRKRLPPSALPSTRRFPSSSSSSFGNQASNTG